ncbi:MAG: hypothetical protein MR544_05035 [Parabacteroides sp.]|nr:hypothetical protein [Parabacteroides sp.]
MIFDDFEYDSGVNVKIVMSDNIPHAHHTFPIAQRHWALLGNHWTYGLFLPVEEWFPTLFEFCEVWLE